MPAVETLKYDLAAALEQTWNFSTDEELFVPDAVIATDDDIVRSIDMTLLPLGGSRPRTSLL